MSGVFKKMALYKKNLLKWELNVLKYLKCWTESVCLGHCDVLCVQAEGFIRVQAPQFSMVSMAVQLTNDLKASDVLTRFLTQER